ncbi:MAG: heme NO-binding domain-containing protein [Spirochaetes bacterium]|nr:heme NO-binding domain-containing protein [Spirochaetota bacterium]
MKGVIGVCLADLVKSKYGETKWKEILKQSGLDEDLTIMPSMDYEDSIIFNVFGKTCEVLKLTREQACDAFGDYWINDYAPKIYGAYYRRFKSAKEFILGMDDVHDMITSTVPNARPPRFSYEEVSESKIVITYKSARNMIDFYVGLIKGIGTYFKTRVSVTKLSEEKVEVVFQ